MFPRLGAAFLYGQLEKEYGLRAPADVAAYRIRARKAEVMK